MQDFFNPISSDDFGILLYFTGWLILMIILMLTVLECISSKKLIITRNQDFKYRE
jgi:hypothetical protein